MKKELKGWIDVNEALPPRFNNVFAKCENGMLNHAVLYNDGIWMEYDTLNPVKDIFKVTHWISKEDILNINQ